MVLHLVRQRQASRRAIAADNGIVVLRLTELAKQSLTWKDFWPAHVLQVRSPGRMSISYTPFNVIIIFITRY